jgi:hypothetical protein
MGKHSIAWYLENDDDFRERAIEHAFKQNPHIVSYEQLVEAFITAYDTDKGQRIIKKWNDEESRALWETDEVQRRVKENRGVDESEDISDEDMEFEVERKVPKGQPTRPSDIVVVKTPKPIRASGYAMQGTPRKGYARGYNKWTNAEKKFVQVRKAKGYSSHDIMKEYNEVFRDRQRSESSVKSQIYRL